MNINPINNFTPNIHQIQTNSGKQLKKIKPPAFTSQFEIDGTSASSRQQVFTLGMLMSNFWIQDSRNTFMDVKRKGVYGNFTIKVHDTRDSIVERILNNNTIYYKKITTNRPGGTYY